MRAWRAMDEGGKAEGQAKQAAYAASRAQWKKQHPATEGTPAEGGPPKTAP